MSQQINLFNPAFEKQKQVLSAATMAQGLLLILLAGIGLNWYGARQLAVVQRAADASKATLDAREARRAKVIGDYPVRQKDPAIGQALLQTEAERAALLEAQKILAGGELGNTQGYSAYFRAFANGRVDGLWLTGANIVGAGSQIGLHGRALQAALIPAYINALGKEPVLKGKSFARLDIAASTPKTPAGATPTIAAAPAPAAPTTSALSAISPELARLLGPAATAAMATPAVAAPPVARPAAPLAYLEFDLQSSPVPADAAGAAKQ